ncbi:hypothetical protein G7009_00760 [Pseudomonas capeferrum]|uniref:hypothetical protein n=1 Tax=Pseudomonas capeferrum TaxID=1495066 RepID=UPI0015E3BAF5|nr:hypothetical protein [Pseudomonas capeferrum]MBA1200335.1 hypothetical protein [Pseudomonas capeferrum]
MDKTDRTPESSPPAGSTQDHLHTIAGEAGSLLSEAKTQGTEQLEQYRDTAADQLESLKEGAQSAASALEGKDTLGLSQYLGQLAGYLGTFADEVRHQSAEELLQKGARLARDNPGLFLAGSVAIGFGLSRFLGASASHSHGSTPSRNYSSDADLSSTPPPAYGASDPYLSSQSDAAPGRSSDVSTHEPFKPTDPLGTGVGSTGDRPLGQDPLKGGV